MSKKTRKKGLENIPSWSWAAAVVGLALVLGSAGYMIFKAIKGDASPPEISISTLEAVRNSNGFLVPIVVENRGESAAAALVVEGEIMDGAHSVETSSITIDYVPAGSVRKAGLIFNEDPREYELQVHAKGYVLP